MNTTVRRNCQSPEPGSPERLPQRWGLIVLATAAAAFVAFLAGGVLATIGVACLVASTLHKVLA